MTLVGYLGHGIGHRVALGHVLSLKTSLWVGYEALQNEETQEISGAPLYRSVH